MGTKYISKIILFVATTFLSINYLLGQNPDSIKTINMEEVMVSANKTEKPFVELTVPAKIISRAEIEKSGHINNIFFLLINDDGIGFNISPIPLACCTPPLIKKEISAPNSEEIISISLIDKFNSHSSLRAFIVVLALLEPPPKALPISEPFPCCNRTNKISVIEISTRIHPNTMRTTAFCG